MEQIKNYKASTTLPLGSSEVPLPVSTTDKGLLEHIEEDLCSKPSTPSRALAGAKMCENGEVALASEGSAAFESTSKTAPSIGLGRTHEADNTTLSSIPENRVIVDTRSSLSGSKGEFLRSASLDGVEKSGIPQHPQQSFFSTSKKRPCEDVNDNMRPSKIPKPQKSAPIGHESKENQIQTIAGHIGVDRGAESRTSLSEQRHIIPGKGSGLGGLFKSLNE